MSILFAHERPSFVGGVEQNIADSVGALRQNQVDCHLAYSPMMPSDPSFLRLFNSAHPCAELSGTNSIIPTQTLPEIARKTGSHTVYLHKLPNVPDSLFRSQLRTVQMVHDHDLCCPRRHKYFAHNSKVCEKPIGMHCYADLAFVVRDRKAPVGIRFESIAKKKQELLKRRCLDLSIVASDFMRQELIMNGFAEDQVLVLPLAVPAAPIRTAAPSAILPTILYVGQLIRGKGVDLLLRALSTLKLPYRAIIVGTGNAEPSLRNLSQKLNLDRHVEFVGWIANESLHHYYAQADVVAVPSRWPEPFGLVGLEAMRYSKPVVAFDVGGIPDWLQHEKNGLLAPAGDVGAFATSLERLIADRKLAATYGIAGSSYLSDRFAYHNYIRALQQALLPSSYSCTFSIPGETAA